MTRKYIFGSIALVFALLAFGCLFLPFYNAYFNGTIGNNTLVGSINVSGIAFALGLYVSGTVDFANRQFTAYMQPSVLIVAILIILIVAACIISIAYKNKWITAEQLSKLADIYMKTEYGKYLKDLAENKFGEE